MIFRVLFVLIFLSSCNRGKSDSTLSQSVVVLGSVDSRIGEASGLVASINNPGFFWTINDSGNPAEIFLIDQHAVIRLVCTLANTTNRDWEDISIDKDVHGKSYLYVADIGDNHSQYKCKMIYRFKEPVLRKDLFRCITQFDTYFFQLSDGKRDAETILIDPKGHDLFIISKRENWVGLYQAPNPLIKDTMIFKKVLLLPFTQIVAGGISPDGKRVLLKNYDKIFLWERAANQSIQQLLLQAPTEVPYQREPQGEAIAWSRDSREFFTLSESEFTRHASLIVHKRNDSHGKRVF